MAKKQKKNKKWLYWLLMLVLFVAAAGVAYLVWSAYFRDNNSGEQNSENTPEVIEVEKQEEPQKQESEEMPSKPKVVQYDGEDPNTSEELSGVITYAGIIGDNLTIRVNIDQFLEGGECKLDVIRNGVLVHEEVTEIVGNVTTASCAGFDVPLEIVGSGAVDIEIGLDSNGKTGVIRGGADI